MQTDAIVFLVSLFAPVFAVVLGVLLLAIPGRPKPHASAPHAHSKAA